MVMLFLYYLPNKNSFRMPKIFNHHAFNEYISQSSSKIDGYLQSGSAALIWSIFEVQDELDIGGNIA
jgi:hypothetical protein